MRVTKTLAPFIVCLMTSGVKRMAFWGGGVDLSAPESLGVSCRSATAGSCTSTATAGVHGARYGVAGKLARLIVRVVIVLAGPAVCTYFK